MADEKAKKKSLLTPEQQAEKERAELRQALADAAKAETEAARAALELEAREVEVEAARKHRERHDALDGSNRVYYFNDAVDPYSVEACRNTLRAWSRLYPGEPIEVVFNSPGGSVFDGFDLFDVIRDLSAKGHHVTTVVAGIAASMAGVLVQAGDTRVIGRRSYLHLHEVSTGALGKASDLKDTAELAERLTMDACRIYAERSNKTADEVYEMMRRHEVYLTAEEALDLGFVDVIR